MSRIKQKARKTGQKRPKQNDESESPVAKRVKTQKQPSSDDDDVDVDGEEKNLKSVNNTRSPAAVPSTSSSTSTSTGSGPGSGSRQTKPKDGKRQKAPKTTTITAGAKPSKAASNKEAAAATANFDQSVATRDPALLSDLIVQKIQKHYSNLTSLEQSDMSLPSSAFRDTTSFEGPHVADTLAKFLTNFTSPPDSLKTCQKPASPHTAVVVGAGMRVADLYRALIVFNTAESKVGKLITKHMKLAEMTKYLQETKVGVIITTPKRLVDLIEAKAVDLDSLRRIVIDGSHQNDKTQTMLDIKEIFLQTIELVNMKPLKERFGLGQGKIELMMF